jgi:hypothetical protein
MDDKNNELLEDLKDEDGNYVLGDSIYDRAGNYVREVSKKNDQKTHRDSI